MIKNVIRKLGIIFLSSLLGISVAYAQLETPQAPPPPPGAQAQMPPEGTRHMRAVWVESRWIGNRKWMQGHYVYYKKYSPDSWVTGYWVYYPKRGIVRGWQWIPGHWQSGRGDEGPGFGPGEGPGMGPGMGPGSEAPGMEPGPGSVGPGMAPGAAPEANPDQRELPDAQNGNSNQSGVLPGAQCPTQ